MRSFRNVIERWPSAEQMAADLGQKGLLIRQWKLRGSIPAAYWNEVVSAAERRGFDGISLEILAGIAQAGKASDLPRKRGRQPSTPHHPAP